MVAIVACIFTEGRKHTTLSLTALYCAVTISKRNGFVEQLGEDACSVQKPVIAIC